jgi:hypothetical protein
VTNTNYDKLPVHMREAIRGYIEDGGHIGGFLTALLSNDLVKTYGKADSGNREAIPIWIDFLYWEAPSPCWGSVEKVTKWQKSGGLNGLTVSSVKEEIE